MSAPPPSTAPPSPSADPSTAARQQVLAVYQAFEDYRTQAYTSGHGDANLQGQVAVGEEYQQLSAQLFEFQQSSYRFKGARVNHPEVTRVDLQASPPTAEIKERFQSGHRSGDGPRSWGRKNGQGSPAVE
ncbi:hypothetical protein [Kitasatospora phosalacinea]|uniref:hypothetical protein n=1 Tax=Kitasatospora phosalacinea TaxID=2065 RepID=UPI002557B37C|nr:hypothetical protein [Kitasatospora phosalacinea]